MLARDQIGRLGRRRFQGFFTRRGTGHFISFAIQIIADQFQDVLFIVDDQYFLFTHIITAGIWLAGC
jgi:hypothetical protein